MIIIINTYVFAKYTINSLIIRNLNLICNKEYVRNQLLMFFREGSISGG